MSVEQPLESSQSNKSKIPSNTSGKSVPSDVFADGLTQLLQPIVLETETRMKAVFQAQIQLEQQIDHLAKELDKFLEKSEQALPSLVGPVQTLVHAKNRLIGINTTLMNIKERLDRLEKQASPSGTSGSSRLPDVFSSFLGKIITTSETPSTNNPNQTSSNPNSTQEPQQTQEKTEEKITEKSEVKDEEQKSGTQET